LQKPEKKHSFYTFFDSDDEMDGVKKDDSTPTTINETFYKYDDKLNVTNEAVDLYFNECDGKI
jgi:hypothetical protein